jgi:hypothetical protein
VAVSEENGFGIAVLVQEISQFLGVGELERFGFNVGGHLKILRSV